jgi:hypothetical protein
MKTANLLVFKGLGHDSRERELFEVPVARTFKAEDITFIVHRPVTSGIGGVAALRSKRWDVSELSTGLSARRGAKTIAEAIELTLNNVDLVGVDRTKRIIRQCLRAYGRANKAA